MKKLLLPILIIILVILGFLYWKSSSAPGADSALNDADDNSASISASLESLNVEDPNEDFDSMEGDINSL